MKILLPVDGSELSLEAVRYAIRLTSEGLQASFVIANVQEPTTLYEMVVAHDPDVLQQVSGAAGVHLLAGAEELLNQADLEHESEVAAGDPAHTLVDIIERFGCDAVIMGARGMGPLSAALVGSVSLGVLRASPVPVTIVKPRPAPEAEEDESAESSV
ncbi:universal stress protein [Piscinibacter sp.]|jgi:nucleotide-binding universal stress UspA family protein|uniref:universal stress protein n=1 Tax=Piscinibacter sp. TaxID=1903157 RepID=UPI00355A04C2